nr:tetratricopeptide repeat protein [uncultured Desulfobulbus sp.]
MCRKAGQGYLKGIGTTVDREKGKEYLQRVCDQGDQFSCVALGLAYAKEKNFRQSMRYYKDACDTGYADGCLELGFVYERGDGGQYSPVTVEKYYTKACQIGSASACANLGLKPGEKPVAAYPFHERMSFSKGATNL